MKTLSVAFIVSLCSASFAFASGDNLRPKAVKESNQATSIIKEIKDGGKVKVAIVGGTGNIGLPVVNRLKASGNVHVLVGSRKADPDNGIMQNEDAVKDADIVIFTVPAAVFKTTVEQLLPKMKRGAVIVSMVVPMGKVAAPGDPSRAILGHNPNPGYASGAAEMTAMVEALAPQKDIKVVAGLHNIPGECIGDPFYGLEKHDVMVMGDDPQACSFVADNVICNIGNLKPVIKGGLSDSKYSEILTSLIIRSKKELLQGRSLGELFDFVKAHDGNVELPAILAYNRAKLDPMLRSHYLEGTGQRLYTDIRLLRAGIQSPREQEYLAVQLRRLSQIMDGADNRKKEVEAAVAAYTAAQAAGKDGGVEQDAGFSDLVELYAENFIVGNAKGSDVGRPMSLKHLREERLNGALLGHSATIKAYVKEAARVALDGINAADANVTDAAAKAREIACARFDEIMRDRINVLKTAGFKTIPVCVGSDRDNLRQDEEIKDIHNQLRIRFSNITADDFEKLTFYVAFEPAGKIGTGQAEDTAVIAAVHQAIYDWFEAKYGAPVMWKIWGKSLKLLYGASVDGKNADGIMAVKSRREDMTGVPLVHGVLFASSGKTSRGFLEVATAVDHAARRDNARYVCFVNLKQFADTEPVEKFAAELHGAFVTGAIDFTRTIVAIADQDKNMKGWRGNVVALSGTQYDGGQELALQLPNERDFTREDMEGQRVLLSLELNIIDDSGKIKSLQRLEEALPTLIDYMEKGVTPVIVAHGGRPKGKVVAGLSLKPVAEALQEMLKGKGYDYKLKFHEGSITERGLKPGLSSEIEEGVINMLENTRFFKGEESNYASFGKELAELVDYEHFGSDAFGAYERVHGCRAGAAPYVQTIAEGPLMKKEYSYLLDAVNVLHGVVMGGGPKFAEKLVIIKNVARHMKEGAFVIWGSAPMITWAEYKWGIKFGIAAIEEKKKSADGQSREDAAKAEAMRAENLKQAAEMETIAAENKLKMLFAMDLIVIDRDPTAINPENGKSWIESKKAPAGATIYEVRLLESGKVINKATGAEMDPSGLYPVDIGTESRENGRNTIMATEKGSSVFYNGPVGTFEIPEFAMGGKAVGESMAEATERNGAVTVIGGGDTVKEAEKNKVNKRVTHCSTGGSASAALLKGEMLKVAKALGKVQEKIIKNLSRFNTDLRGLMRYVSAGKQQFNAVGGQSYRQYVNDLKKSMAGIPGYLPECGLKAEVVSGQAATPGLRVVFSLSGLETSGTAVDGVTEAGARSVAAIEKILKATAFDLSKYSDLTEALALVRKEAGEQYETIPQCAVQAVSEALTAMSAKLNGMETAAYVRWNAPAERDGAVPASKDVAAIMVSDGYFRTPGALTALAIASQLEKRVKIMVYGANSDGLRLLLTNDAVMAAATIEEALRRLGDAGVASGRVVVLKTPEEADAEEDALLLKQGVTIITSSEAATITLAKAVKETVGTADGDKAFAGFYKSLADTKVISGRAYESTSAAMVARLEAQTLELPTMEISVSDDLKDRLAKAREVTATFINKV